MQNFLLKYQHVYCSRERKKTWNFHYILLSCINSHRHSELIMVFCHTFIDMYTTSPNLTKQEIICLPQGFHIAPFLPIALCTQLCMCTGDWQIYLHSPLWILIVPTVRWRESNGVMLHQMCVNGYGDYIVFLCPL